MKDQTMGAKLAEQLQTQANNPNWDNTHIKNLLEEAAQTIKTLEDSNMDLVNTLRGFLLGQP
jgi:alkyl sulfatase BDS1-like metallo-beta-lactamase superfamily hydrolase